eukprot:5713069-Amphidinium_carterae.1
MATTFSTVTLPDIPADFTNGLAASGDFGSPNSEALVLMDAHRTPAPDLANPVSVEKGSVRGASAALGIALASISTFAMPTTGSEGRIVLHALYAIARYRLDEVFIKNLDDDMGMVIRDDAKVKPSRKG